MEKRSGEKPLFAATAAVFVTTDLKSRVEWYRDKLGFNCDIDWRVNPTFAIVERQGASIMLKQAEKSSPPLRRLTPGLALFDAYIWVSDIEKLHAALKAADAPIVEGPVRRVYGCTEIAVEDPDGKRIHFGYCP